MPLHAWHVGFRHLTRERYFQTKFKATVWCKVIGDYVVGGLCLRITGKP